MRMTRLRRRNTMTATPFEAPWPVSRRAARTVVVVDVVESVRLMEQGEEDFVQRWHAFVAEVMSSLLPQHGGRLVKSLGDGLMVEFEAVPSAIQCALAMQTAIAQSNTARPSDRWMCLRVGAHVADVFADEHDIYGAGVNLAARLTTLAGPGEIVVSADLRDQLTSGLDAVVEDLGECHLKHIAQAVRTYRVGPVGEQPVIHAGASSATQLRPSIAVVPFSCAGDDPRLRVLGEMIADEVINVLSRTAEMHVISRLSTSAFRERPDMLGDVKQHLRANYLATGSCRLVSSERLRLHVELVEVGTGHVAWSDTWSLAIDAALGQDAELADQISVRIAVAVLANELRQARTRPLPNLGAYTMLLGGVMLLHRFSPRDFERAKEVLESLTQRVPRHATPWAWLARWHDLKVFQGWSTNPKLDREAALSHCRRALDIDPESSIALTTAGAVHGVLLKDLDAGIGYYRRAIDSNPNEPLAWLLLGAAHAFRGDGDMAVQASEMALRLSPMDPMRFFYDSLAATAAASAGQFDRAIELASRSVKSNRLHASTFRVLAIAQSLSGQMEAARDTVAQLLALEPDFTVQRFLERSPGADYDVGRRFAEALRAAGLPSGRTRT
jgi:adenylate cyclase